MERCRDPQCLYKATKQEANKTITSVLEAAMVEANSNCPKCARGTMKLISSPEQLVPKLPEQNKLTAECDKCGHKDEVEVVVTDE